MIAVNAPKSQIRADIGNISWRDQLLELARLLERLTPDYSDLERFLLQKSALANELRRLARRISNQT
jgi:hypothetical protein